MQVENDNHQQRVENYIEYRLKEGNINSGWVLFHTQIFHFWDTGQGHLCRRPPAGQSAWRRHTPPGTGDSC